jgi:cell division transport system ATP-binding protein
MIHFNKVSKIYSDKSVALKDISFQVGPGEFVSVVGHSGAGKTTLIKMILAEEKPTAGQVFFQSVDINALRPKYMNNIRRRIGAIFQDFRLLPNKNTFENIAFAMEAAGRHDEEILADVPHVLDLVGLPHKMWNFPHELSGGERQRVAIARAIVNQPDVILADEPTGNLDEKTAESIMSIFSELSREHKVTTVMITHDHHIASFADRIYRLHDSALSLHHV